MWIPRLSLDAEKENIGFSSDKSIILKILSVSVYKICTPALLLPIISPLQNNNPH